jgi:hypothetical protein
MITFYLAMYYTSKDKDVKARIFLFGGAVVRINAETAGRRRYSKTVQPYVHRRSENVNLYEGGEKPVSERS